MQRQDNISAAQARFDGYRLHALDMEKRKSKIKAGVATRRARSIYIVAAHEDELDKAWEEIECIADNVGEEEADIVAEHYLLCQDWYDIAAYHDISRFAAVRRAKKAFKWLDSQEEETT